MQKQIFLLATVSILLAGCTLQPGHFKGEDLLDDAPKKEAVKTEVSKKKDPVKAEVKTEVKTETTKPAAVKETLKPEVPKTETGKTEPVKLTPPSKPEEKPLEPKVAEAKKAEQKIPAVSTCPPPRADAAKAIATEVLKNGSRIHVNVFREKDLTGDYQVNGNGMITFPMLGAVQAQGLTPSALQEKIRSGLANGYLVKPDVSVTRLPDCPS